jgi:hypothetical protein
MLPGLGTHDHIVCPTQWAVLLAWGDSHLQTGVHRVTGTMPGPARSV